MDSSDETGFSSDFSYVDLYAVIEKRALAKSSRSFSEDDDDEEEGDRESWRTRQAHRHAVRRKRQSMRGRSVKPVQLSSPKNKHQTTTGTPDQLATVTGMSALEEEDESEREKPAERSEYPNRSDPVQRASSMHHAGSTRQPREMGLSSSIHVTSTHQEYPNRSDPVQRASSMHHAGLTHQRASSMHHVGSNHQQRGMGLSSSIHVTSNHQQRNLGLSASTREQKNLGLSASIHGTSTHRRRETRRSSSMQFIHPSNRQETFRSSAKNGSPVREHHNVNERPRQRLPSNLQIDNEKLASLRSSSNRPVGRDASTRSFTESAAGNEHLEHRSNSLHSEKHSKLHAGQREEGRYHSRSLRISETHSKLNDTHSKKSREGGSLRSRARLHNESQGPSADFSDKSWHALSQTPQAHYKSDDSRSSQRSDVIRRARVVADQSPTKYDESHSSSDGTRQCRSNPRDRLSRSDPFRAMNECGAPPSLDDVKDIRKSKPGNISQLLRPTQNPERISKQHPGNSPPTGPLKARSSGSKIDRTNKQHPRNLSPPPSLLRSQSSGSSNEHQLSMHQSSSSLDAAEEIRYRKPRLSTHQSSRSMDAAEKIRKRKPDYLSQLFNVTQNSESMKKLSANPRPSSCHR